jgi:hypothetical protein
MAERNTYDQQLRTIGQSLEAQRIKLFELHQRGERYVVKGEPEKERTLLAALRSWQKHKRSAGLDASLNYSLADIDELDRQGRGQRSQANRLPDFHRLSNTLRTVGYYLDQKGSKLVELHKRELSISILSQNQAGHPEFEERSVASFYELFVRLHGRRSNNWSKT